MQLLGNGRGEMDDAREEERRGEERRMMGEEMGEEKRGRDRRRMMRIRSKWVKRNRGETDRG